MFFPLLTIAPARAGAFFWPRATWWRLVPVVLLGLVLGSCALVPAPRPDSSLSLACWNVENLFDEVADGGEYPEFDPRRGWNRAQFWRRCDSLGKVIRSLGFNGADVLVLEEVEGQHALEVLNQRFLADLGYRHAFLAPPEVPGVKTAVLSRFPFLRTGLHFPRFDQADEPLRPLVEVEVDLGGRSLVVIGNHWKSRLPTPRATEEQRRASAQALRSRLADIEGRSDHPFVVALGDFNTSVELSQPWFAPALVSGPWDPGNTGGLEVIARRTEATACRSPGAVWDPWELVDSPRGSYFYQGVWNRLDHAFVTAASLRCPDWTVGTFVVQAFAPTPPAYGPRTPNGVSDHFPLVLTLVRK